MLIDTTQFLETQQSVIHDVILSLMDISPTQGDMLLTGAMTEEINRLHDERVWPPLLLLSGMASMDHIYVLDVQMMAITTVFFVDAWHHCPKRGACPKTRSSNNCLLASPNISGVEDFEPIPIPDSFAKKYCLATTGKAQVFPAILNSEVHWHEMQSIEKAQVMGNYEDVLSKCVDGHFALRGQAYWNVHVNCLLEVADKPRRIKKQWVSIGYENTILK